jgi:hypothetical protein
MKFIQCKLKDDHLKKPYKIKIVQSNPSYVIIQVNSQIGSHKTGGRLIQV